MDFSIKDKEINQQLQQLQQLLEQNETIRQFKKIEIKVKNNATLTKLTEEIKTAQKEAVQFAHYGKSEAEKRALQRADRLTKEFNEHPLVINYREYLVEANDIIQYITRMIQQKINEELGEDTK